MGWLDHQAAVVIGGGSGIGLAVAERDLAERPKVAVLKFNAERAASTATVESVIAYSPLAKA